MIEINGGSKGRRFHYNVSSEITNPHQNRKYQQQNAKCQFESMTRFIPFKPVLSFQKAAHREKYVTCL